MSTNDPMAQEQLDAIEVRLGCGTPTTEDVSILLAEVERLRARLTVDEDMVERAARAMCDIEAQADQAMWDKLDEDERDVWRIDARAALDAALGTGEES